MSDPRIVAVADTLVNYSTRIQPGDLVAITGSTETVLMIQAVYQKVLEAGGHPLVITEIPGIQELFFEFAGDEQLTFISPVERLILNEFDATIGVRGAVNTKALSSVDPSRQAKRQAARRELSEVFMRRSAEGSLKWVGTLFPTNAHAQDAEMSLREYEDFVYAACLVNEPDPAAAWQEVAGNQARLIESLSDKDQVHITSENTDLTLSIKGRTFVNADGKYNFPDGEIFTGPVESSVNGVVTFDFPAITAGREVEGVRLRFEDGRVVEASARKNEAFLHEMLKTDEGAPYLGEFAFGANYGIQRFTKNILFDEKIGGTVHMALGAGYPETGSQNKSAIHWDMICDLRRGGEVYVDGELFQKDGKFLV
ncbi:MAG: aminopeptidase [Anaerolineae bacterium]